MARSQRKIMALEFFNSNGALLLWIKNITLSWCISCKWKQFGMNTLIIDLVSDVVNVPVEESMTLTFFCSIWISHKAFLYGIKWSLWSCSLSNPSNNWRKKEHLILVHYRNLVMEYDQYYKIHCYHLPIAYQTKSNIDSSLLLNAHLLYIVPPHLTMHIFYTELQLMVWKPFHNHLKQINILWSITYFSYKHYKNSELSVMQKKAFVK